MVSFQSTPFIELNQIKTILDSETNSKKRKWDNDLEAEELVPKYKQWMNYKVDVGTTKSFSDIDLHLETPLPSDWQRCLDIQSGEIYFYNTRTQKRTVRDPREGPCPDPGPYPNPTSPRDCHMSLDLQLNLPCGSLNNNSSSKSSQETKLIMTRKSSSSPPKAAPTDLFKILGNSIEKTSLSDNSKDDEMVAAACMRCHMLVVLQKSSPTCPNCKFVHPPYQTIPELFKPKLSLSC